MAGQSAPKGQKKFEKGNQYRWEPGKSGNPSGRPAGSVEHRRRCRELADRCLTAFERGNCNPGLVRLYEAVADRGGYLPVHKLIHADAERARIMLLMLRLEGMSEEERNHILDRWLTEPLPDLAQLGPDKEELKQLTEESKEP